MQPKKLLCLIIALMMILSLCGCSKKLESISEANFKINGTEFILGTKFNEILDSNVLKASVSFDDELQPKEKRFLEVNLNTKTENHIYLEFTNYTDASILIKDSTVTGVEMIYEKFEAPGIVKCMGFDFLSSIPDVEEKLGKASKSEGIMGVGVAVWEDMAVKESDYKVKFGVVEINALVNSMSLYIYKDASELSEKDMNTKQDEITVPQESVQPTEPSMLDSTETTKPIKPTIERVEGSPLEKITLTINNFELQLGVTTNELMTQMDFIDVHENFKKDTYILQPGEIKSFSLSVQKTSDLIIEVCNDTDVPKQILDCPIYQVGIMSDQYGLMADTTIHGLNAKSDIDDFVAAFGEYNVVITDQGECYEWRFEEDGMLTALQIYSPLTNNKLLVLNYALWDRSPLYAKDKFEFSIDGIKYTWGQKFADMKENMTLVSGFEELLVEPGQRAYGFLKDKNGNEYKVGVANRTNNKLDLLSCEICYLYVKRGTKNTLTLMDKITFDSTVYETEKVFKQIPGSVTDNRMAYYCSASSPDTFVIDITMFRQTLNNNLIDLIVITSP